MLRTSACGNDGFGSTRAFQRGSFLATSKENRGQQDGHGFSVKIAMSGETRKLHSLGVGVPGLFTYA